MKTITDARRMVLTSVLLHGASDPTEAYIMDCGAQRGFSAAQTNEAIGQLVADGDLMETTIETPARPHGFGAVDALRYVP